MRIVYDQDSEEVANRILAGLSAQGWFDLVAGAAHVQREMEDRLVNVFNAARETALYDGIAALRMLFGDDDGRLSPLGQSFLDHARQLAPNNPRFLGEQVLVALAQLAPEGTYKPRVPLNVVAALDAAYHAAVLPRRCFEAARSRLRQMGERTGNLGDLVLVDDDGVQVYGSEEHRESAEQERAFWEMFDRVLERFDLSAVVGSLDSSKPINERGVRTIADENQVPIFRLAAIAAGRAANQ